MLQDKAMTSNVHKSSSQNDRRPWTLILLAMVAGIAFGILAIVLDGTPRATCAAVSIVLLAVAGYCASAVWLESSDGPSVDLEAPSAEPPVPQSQVALIHDPGSPPNNALQVTRETRAPERGRYAP